MKKMKSLKGGLAGILFTAGLLAASCTSDQSSSAVTIVNRPDCTQTNVNYVGNRLPLKPMNFIKLPVGSIQPEGWLKKYLELQKDGLTGHLNEISAWLGKENNAWLTKEEITDGKKSPIG
mgnify:FL=1